MFLVLEHPACLRLGSIDREHVPSGLASDSIDLDVGQRLAPTHPRFKPSQSPPRFNRHRTMVVGTLVGTASEMGGELAHQSYVAAISISHALCVGVLGPPAKPARKPSPRLEPSPRAATPSPSAVAASPREQQQVYAEEEQERKGPAPPQREVSPVSSSASFFSLPQQRARGFASPSPAGFDEKTGFPKGVRPPAVLEKPEELGRLHHTSVDVSAEEEGAAGGMVVEEPMQKFGRPRSGPLSRRGGHVKQVKCSVM